MIRVGVKEPLKEGNANASVFVIPFSFRYRYRFQSYVRVYSTSPAAYPSASVRGPQPTEQLKGTALAAIDQSTAPLFHRLETASKATLNRLACVKIISVALLSTLSWSSLTCSSCFYLEYLRVPSFSLVCHPEPESEGSACVTLGELAGKGVRTLIL